GPLLLKALELIEKGEAPRIPQDESQATYVSTIDKSFGNIDFSEPAEKIERFFRGLDPWPSAFTKLNGKNLKLYKGKVKETADLPEEYKNAVPGTVVSVSRDSFDVLCGKGIISIKQLQLEGKKRMDTADFLRGYEIAPGTVLGN
ncbi:MAG: methionyl-tRNA formyltransferase, partial [Lachnospiraceae bacterium]|nr:methionyl-tRNA formyltransferase [Lachnospiraceae bacterium]